MLELILGIVFLIYILFIGQLIYGCNRMKRFSRKEFTSKTSFSIVVPFRNEKENLPNLLHSISLLHYPKELVEVIAKSLVENPDEVVVTETEKEDAIIVELKVGPADMGKVIGRQGRIAKAIRTVVKAASSKSSKKVIVDILQ